MRNIFKSGFNFILRPLHNPKTMKKAYPSLHIYYILAFVSMGFFTSCSPVKNVIYFENMQRDTTLNSMVNNNFDLKIRKNDLLSISIISPDKDNTPFFNGVQGGVSPSGSTGGSGSASGSSGGSSAGGFLVDNDGNIEMYKIGVIHVLGLTRKELKYKLEKALAPYLLNPVITIRFLNNRVTMLGEVTKPQVITIPNEQISLLEALGMSGDLTITGRRDNILVIRETENGKQFKRVNLTDNSIFKSPFYYLQPDDVVYVEPTKYKIKTIAQSQQTVNYVLTGISILITLLVYLRR